MKAEEGGGHASEHRENNHLNIQVLLGLWVKEAKGSHTLIEIWLVQQEPAKI